MQLSDISNPAERKKLIVAGALFIVALILLWWAFIGFGSSAPTTPPRVAVQPTPRPTPVAGQPPSALPVDAVDELQPLNYPVSIPAVAEARRNIFVYYEPPPPPVKEAPTPTPPPPPPVLLANLSPSNVYARTGDFTLEVAGDKFTAQLRLFIDGAEVPTRYRGPQQLTATVPATDDRQSGEQAGRAEIP